MALLLLQKLSQGFSALWTRFPNKKDKKGAEKVYDRIVTPEIDAKIHAALDWQIPEWEALEWYTPPYLKTYLNQERYNDEPSKPKPTMTRNPAIGRAPTPEQITAQNAVAQIESLVRRGMDPEAAKRQVYLAVGWIRE